MQYNNIVGGIKRLNGSDTHIIINAFRFMREKIIYIEKFHLLLCFEFPFHIDFSDSGILLGVRFFFFFCRYSVPIYFLFYLHRYYLVLNTVHRLYFDTLTREYNIIITIPTTDCLSCTRQLSSFYTVCYEFKSMKRTDEQW